MLPVSKAGEAEFPGIPSTQEWQEDFPATQIPHRRSRSAYLTPHSSFNAPADETEIDGFDHRTLALASAPRTPARKLNKLQRMPPTPVSATKRDSSAEKEHARCNSSKGQVDCELGETSTLKSESRPASPFHQSKSIVRAETGVHSRRQRRRPKKRNRNLPPSPTGPCRAASEPAPAASDLSSPEPWPLPFPLADKGIYPYLPPAQQFDQMVKFTSATEEHIDKWELHDSTYPIPLLREVLSAQECVHMGFHAQLEHLNRFLGELEQMMKPIPAKERARRGWMGEQGKRVTPQMLQKIKFMKSITNQQQVCFFESRIPTRANANKPRYNRSTYGESGI